MMACFLWWIWSENNEEIWKHGEINAGSCVADWGVFWDIESFNDD